MAGALEFLFGTPDRFEQIDKFDPQRQAAFNQLLQTVLPQLLSSIQDGGFEPIAEREKQRFMQETVPSLAERFTGMGAGAQRSSGFQEALARGGSELGTNLAALGSQFGMQRQSQLMNLLGMGLTPQQETGFFPGRTGFLGALAPGIGQGLGLGATMKFLGGGRQQAPGSISVGG